MKKRLETNQVRVKIAIVLSHTLLSTFCCAHNTLLPLLYKVTL